MKAIFQIILVSLGLAVANAAFVFFGINFLHYIVIALTVLLVLGFVMSFMKGKKDTGVRVGNAKVYQMERLVEGDPLSFIVIIAFFVPALYVGNAINDYQDQERIDELLEGSVSNLNEQYIDVISQTPNRRKSIDSWRGETELMIQNVSSKDVVLFELSCKYTLVNGNKRILHEENRQLEDLSVPGMRDLIKIDVTWPSIYQGKEIDLKQWKTTAEKCDVESVVPTDVDPLREKVVVSSGQQLSQVVVTNNSNMALDEVTLHCLRKGYQGKLIEKEYQFNLFAPDEGFSQAVDYLEPKKSKPVHNSEIDEFDANSDCIVLKVVMSESGQES